MLLRTLIPIARSLLILLAAAGVVVTIIPEVPATSGGSAISIFRGSKS